MKVDNRFRINTLNNFNKPQNMTKNVNFSGNFEPASFNTQKAKGLIALGSVLSLIGGIFIGNVSKNVSINIGYTDKDNKNNTTTENISQSLDDDSLQADSTSLNNQEQVEEEIATVKPAQKKANNEFVPGPNFDYSQIEDPKERIHLFLNDPSKTKEEKYKFIGDNDPLIIQTKLDIAYQNAMVQEITAQAAFDREQALQAARANEERVRLNNQLMMDEQRNKARAIELERVMNRSVPDFGY